MGIKLEKYFSQEGGSLIMAMLTDECWGGHFCVEPGIFVSNRAFLCRTMHFAVEPSFFCVERVLKYIIIPVVIDREFVILLFDIRYIGVFK